MRNNTNTQTIEGRIYQHNLQVRKVENQASENYGKEFINGTIDVATDDAGMNILQVHYSYVTEITKSGKMIAARLFLQMVWIMQQWFVSHQVQH